MGVGEWDADGTPDWELYAGEKQSQDGELQVSSSNRENGELQGLSADRPGMSGKIRRKEGSHERKESSEGMNTGKIRYEGNQGRKPKKEVKEVGKEAKI